MKTKKAYQNETGFSLIEMMIAVGISAVLVMGTVGVLNMQAQGIKMVKISGDVDSVAMLVKFALSDRHTCSNNKNRWTGGKPPAKLTAPVGFDYIDPTTLAPTGPIVRVEPEDPAKVTVEKIQVGPFSKLSTIGASTPDEKSVWLGTVAVNLRRPNTMGGAVVKREFPIQFLTDGANNILNCSADEGTPVAVCDTMGGTINSSGKCVLPPPPVAAGTPVTLDSICASMSGTWDPILGKCTLPSGTSGTGSTSGSSTGTPTSGGYTGGTPAFSCVTIGTDCYSLDYGTPNCPVGKTVVSTDNSCKCYPYGCQGGWSATCCGI
jgi:prepilin-type N-terminal cleavage/methylation domain-containing protein